MKITREWGMPNKHTFSILPIKKLLVRHIGNAEVVVDPFSGGERNFGTITNDLNPEVDADYHLEAVDFLRGLPPGVADVILLDPPYSPRQIAEVYSGVGKAWNGRNAELLGEVKDVAKRVLRVGGKAICMAWNSTGMGKRRCFNLMEILLVSHGGAHNDTIVTVEEKLR